MTASSIWEVVWVFYPGQAGVCADQKAETLPKTGLLLTNDEKAIGTQRKAGRWTEREDNSNELVYGFRPLLSSCH